MTFHSNANAICSLCEINQQDHATIQAEKLKLMACGTFSTFIHP